MSTPPQWKRVLISGSNLEVNHLTSSTALEPFKVAGIARDLVFASETGGHFQITSSINNKHQISDTSPNLFLLSESVNVPNLPISASTVGTPIVVTEASPPLISFPVVFKNEPHGGFEITSSVFYEPTLGFFASQSTPLNSQIRSGSKPEGPDAGDGSDAAPIPLVESPAPTSVEFAITFTGSFGFTPENESFIDASNGDFMQFRRAIPAGQGITASFTLPIIGLPKGASYTSPGDKFKIVLRKYEVGSLLTPAGTFTDQEIEISLLDPTLVPPGNPQEGNTNQTLNTGITGSATGSFNVDGPINVGDKFQLRFKKTDGDTNIFYIGERPNGTGGDFDRSKFIFDGATFDPGNTLAADLSGSFIGNVQANASSSLTGVTLDGVGDIQRHNGIIFLNSAGSSFSTFNGTQETTMSIRFGGMSVTGNSGGVNKAGLELNGISDSILFAGGAASVDVVSPTPLQLALGLPQDGLSFGGSFREQINIHFTSNPGLTTTGGNLHIANTFPGAGLSGSFGGVNGSASINLNPSQSGLTTTQGTGIETNKLMLNSGLPGDGLEFNASDPNNRSDLRLDTNFAVTGSGSIQIGNPISPFNNPLQFKQFHNDGASSNTGNTFNVSYNNNSTSNAVGLNNVQIDIQSNFTEEYTFKDNLIISGNFRVLDSSNVTSINTPDFRTTDPFILLNSGSNTTSPFSFDNGGFIVQTSSYAQGGSGQASGSAIFTEMGVDTITINDEDFNYSGWGVTKGKVPWDAHSPVPPFSTNPTPERILSSSHTAYLSMVKLSGLGTIGDPGAGNEADTFYDATTVDNLGSWYIDTGSTGTSVGGESNVYLYGIFD